MLTILYAGSPAVAAQSLADIVRSGKHRVVGVLTNPPAVRKRGKEPVPTEVAQMVHALNNENPAQNIALFEPQKLSEVAEQIRQLKPDILVCFAYGKIFSRSFLSIFPKGGINLHPSLLPLYRGCAPVPAAILHEDSETGISIQRIAYEMDAGNILIQTHIPLNGTETTESLLHDVGLQGGSLLLNALDAIDVGTVTETVQDSSKATYCGMLKKEDGCIDWNNPSKSICAKIRAFHPWPGAFTSVNGVPLLIHQAVPYDYTGGVFPAECSSAQPGTVIGTDKRAGILIRTGDGVLAVTNLQWQTKKAMPWKDFINGSRNFIGSICG